MTRSEKATENFMAGYNCSQAVSLAFADLLPIDEKTLSKLACSFGGGMGRLREVCGAVSVPFMVIGSLYGYPGPETGSAKAEHYARVQEFASLFREKYGTISCSELLGRAKGSESHVPEERTKKYYESRPCPGIIEYAADLLEEYINLHGGKRSTGA